MLTLFRKMLRSKIGPFLFGIVIIGMAMWGIEDIFSGSGGNIIKAGERGISMQEFDNNVQDRLRDLSREQGRAVTKAEAVDTGIVDQLFQQEASRLITLGYGEGIGARASTDAVMKEVFKQEAFNNALSGKFDSQVYEDVLARNNLTPNRFEQNVRDDLTTNYVFNAAGAAIEPPSAYADLLAKYEGEARSVSILRINSADVSELPEPTEEDLQTYFNENTAGFGEPERRAITVLHFSPEDFRQSVEITEEMLTAAYEAGKVRRYSTPQTRKYVEAYFATEAAALQALGILAAGGAPDTLENVVTISEQTSQKDALADIGFADRLFSIPQGAVTEPTVSGDQWVIARVEEVILGDPYPFEEVRDQVRATLVSEAAQSAFEEAARNLDDLKGEGLTLQEIGERIGAPAISYLPVDQRAYTRSRAVMIGLASTYPEALRGAAEMFEDEITDRFDLADGGIYLGQLDKIVPPSTPAFEDVKDRVRASWQVTNRGEAVTLFSEQLTQKINRGETTLAAEAGALGKPLTRPERALTRSAPSDGLPSSALLAIFAVNEVGSVVSSPSDRQGEFLLISIDKIEAPDEDTTAAMRTPIRDLLTRQLDSDLGAALGAEIGDAVEVVSNDGAFAAYKARNAGQ